MKENFNKEIAKQGIKNILSQNKNILDIISEEKNSQIVDFDEHLKEVQKRVYSALHQDFQYSDVTNNSDTPLLMDEERESLGR